MANCSVIVKQRLLGLPISNVWYVGDGIDPDTHGQAIADMFWDAYNAHLKTLLSSNWSYEGVAVRDLDIPDQATRDFVPTSGVLAGTGSIDTLATQTSLMLRLFATSNRPNRGRKYIRGIDEGSLSGGDYIVTAVNAAVAFGQALVAGVPVIEAGSGLIIARVDPVTKLITAANAVSNVAALNLPRSLTKSSRPIPS